jgi:hypothetical protein
MSVVHDAPQCEKNPRLRCENQRLRGKPRQVLAAELIWAGFSNRLNYLPDSLCEVMQ